MMRRTSSGQDMVFLLIISAFFCLWRIGWGSLATWDEALYAFVAREITRTGDFWHLTYRGADWYVKPPLAIWATAFFYKVWGVSEFATRLFSALSGIGTVLLTYALGRSLFDRRVGLIGAGILLSSTDYLHFARWGMMDIPNLFFFTGALLCFAEARKKSWNGPMLFYLWLFAAGAFMTKGPVIALAFFIIFAASLWNRDLGFIKKSGFWTGAIVALALVLPWHLAAYFQNPHGFVHEYLGVHWFGRSGRAMDGHTGNAYFYIRTLLNKYHPWVLLLPFSLPYALWSAARAKDFGARLLSVWIFVVFSFFTFLVATKLKWYIFPMYPALGLAGGLLLSRILNERFDIWVRAFMFGVLALHIPFSSVIVQDFSGGIKAVAPIVQERTAPDEDVVLFQFHEFHAADFYFDRLTQAADTLDELDRSLMEHHGRLRLIVPAALFEKLRPSLESRGFTLIHETRHPKDNVVFLMAG